MGAPRVAAGRSPSCWSGMSPPEPICRAHASCHMRRQTLQQGGKGTLAVQPRFRALNGLLQPLSPTAQRDYQDYGRLKPAWMTTPAENFSRPSAFSHAVLQSCSTGKKFQGWSSKPVSRSESRARNNIAVGPPSRVSRIRVLVMKRNYTGIPLRMDGGQPGHANHAI